MICIDVEIPLARIYDDATPAQFKGVVAQPCLPHVHGRKCRRLRAVSCTLFARRMSCVVGVQRWSSWSALCPSAVAVGNAARAAYSCVADSRRQASCGPLPFGRKFVDSTAR